MLDHGAILLAKAAEGLAGAESELANGRYNNSANRAYYACFQAAIAALMHEGVQPSGDRWSHEAVPGLFDGVLINRRKLYASDLRGALDRHHVLRLRADYGPQLVTEVEMNRMLRRTRGFVAAVQERRGGLG
jgi:uncharacterized protein (UPF0332 family)